MKRKHLKMLVYRSLSSRPTRYKRIIKPNKTNNKLKLMKISKKVKISRI